MRKVVLALTLVLSLAGCANIQNAWETVTGARVSPTAVYIARNVFDGFERTATNYLVFCHGHPTNAACSKAAEAQLVPAVRSGRVARRKLVSYMKTHPDAIGAEGVYSALIDSTDALKRIFGEYNITVSQ